MTKETWTVLKVLNWTKGYLADKGVENARLEAEWLLCHAIGLDRVGLYVNYEKPLSDAELTAFRGMVSRRAKREPLQYILGTQEFFGLEFMVTPAVLIPRHDTETLVEQALRLAPGAKSVLDIGTGSGCIAIALAKNLAGAAVTAVEKSADTLALARKNAEKLQAAVDFREGSFFEPVAGQRFELIVSNPPYIPTADLATLQPEVRDFEPQSALDGGQDGLDCYRALVLQAPDFLELGGWLLLEVGINQAQAVSDLLRQTGMFTNLLTARDHGNIDRVVGGQRIS
jgi:release factor glutamine methyltransferase